MLAKLTCSSVFWLVRQPTGSRRVISCAFFWRLILTLETVERSNWLKQKAKEQKELWLDEVDETTWTWAKFCAYKISRIAEILRSKIMSSFTSLLCLKGALFPVLTTSLSLSRKPLTWICLASQDRRRQQECRLWQRMTLKCSPTNNTQTEQKIMWKIAPLFPLAAHTIMRLIKQNNRWETKWAQILTRSYWQHHVESRDLLSWLQKVLMWTSLWSSPSSLSFSSLYFIVIRALCVGLTGETEADEDCAFPAIKSSSLICVWTDKARSGFFNDLREISCSYCCCSYKFAHYIQDQIQKQVVACKKIHQRWGRKSFEKEKEKTTMMTINLW